MTTVMVTHEVHDFDAWLAVFDAGDEVRSRHGATGVRVLRDGGRVVGLVDFPDEDSARGFLADPLLRTPIDGVPSKPEVRVLDELAHRLY
jgi:hypothetical protein